MSKKFKTYDLYDHIYQCPILLIIGGDKIEAQKFFYRRLEVEVSDEELFCDESVGSTFSHKKKKGVMIWLKDAPSNPGTTAILIHECFHAMNIVLQCSGVQPCNYENDEHYALNAVDHIRYSKGAQVTLKQLLDEWPRVKEEISPWPWELHAVGDVALLIFEKGGIKSVLDVWTKTGKKDQLFIASAPQNYDLLVQALGEIAKIIPNLKNHECFCEVGIGNPNMSSHASYCDELKAWLTKWGFQEEERC